MEADTPAFGDESDATVVMEYSEGEDSLVVVASDNNGGDRGGNDSRLEGVVVGNTRDEVDDVGNGQDEGVDVRDGRASIGGEVEDVPKWVLVDCGGVSVESTDSGFVQRFRPWLYMFVRTESTFAFERLFRALFKYARNFFGVEVAVSSASIDHADGIASALELVWPDVEVLTCWEQLLRQARKHSELTNDKDFIKDQAVPHLRLLHSASRLRNQSRAIIE
ncbi:hypothetical protein PF006_g1420 [Phytophthora fragariae]|uniref:MULE transposase domain-containing protein n=1 Tax=Phytophthora fragariae TaxID=53985 RepID=A0A6A3UTB8_9STRA|nr:hypothetical protein PF003_g27088 [Phytophthora fragariae]KAE9154549.1 hypothetical protein PF006_g1420 [Phytophthora fragariae]